MSKSTSVRQQRRAVRAMKHAAFFGFDPRNSTTMQGACYANPVNAAKAKALSSAIDKVEKIKRYQPAFSISDAIGKWDDDNE